MQKTFLKKIIKILGPCDIYEKGKWMPISEDYINNNFDLDLDFGKVGEKYIEQVFEGDGRIEVKTERDIWKTTGNIAIELRYRGNPSGLSTTESSVWVHLLSHNGVIEGGFMFKVDLLKEKIKKLHKSGDIKMVMGGDDNLSQMVLLPINELFSKGK